jgi:hypothetical protein
MKLNTFYYGTFGSMLDSGGREARLQYSRNGAVVLSKAQKSGGKGRRRGWVVALEHEAAR